MLNHQLVESYRLDMLTPTKGLNDTTSKSKLIFYDVSVQRGKYWNSEQNGKAFDFGAVLLPTREWDASIVQLQALVDQIGA